MSAGAEILAAGRVDARGVAGSSGVRGVWTDLGVQAPGTAASFRALFGRPDATFRRIDRASRALVLAAEAAGLAEALPRTARDDTALVIETERGCLEADLRFQRGLERDVLEGAVFPYTLPSAALGELALRHGLRGPALCLSIGADGRGEALREAVRLIEEGAVTYAVAGRVEALSEARADLGPGLHAVVVLLAPRGTRAGAAACDIAPGDGLHRIGSSIPT